nr:60S ribosomal protein L11 [Tanacetum cinerariifolium]
MLLVETPTTKDYRCNRVWVSVNSHKMDSVAAQVFKLFGVVLRVEQRMMIHIPIQGTPQTNDSFIFKHVDPHSFAVEGVVVVYYIKYQKILSSLIENISENLLEAGARNAELMKKFEDAQKRAEHVQESTQRLEEKVSNLESKNQVLCQQAPTMSPIGKSLYARPRSMITRSECSKTKDDIFLNEFTLHGIAPAPAGEQMVKVCFSIDFNGIMNVAEELESNARGDKAMQLLESGLKIKEYELLRRNFSDTGCFDFGIHEQIDLGIKYDPSTGVYGMDFFVVEVFLNAIKWWICAK